MKDYLPKSNTQDDFRAAMRAAGLDYGGPLTADGKLHRFKANNDHQRNSWFVLHSDSPAAGAFGCWKRGMKKTWSECNSTSTESDLNKVRRRWLDAEREREQEEAARRDGARKSSARILARAKPVQSHPYLERKGVNAHGELRRRDDQLIVPLRDASGELHSLQFIAPDNRFGGERDKTFLRGGRCADCFFTVADKSDGPLVICEGYATGASIHEATGFATVCAMDCGNLLAVAKSLREKHPTREIIIAADNDAFTTGNDSEPRNPGIEAATKAAKTIGARLAIPHFAGVSSKPTDFNDLATLAGLAEVKGQIESATLKKESDDELVARLAALPPLEYERLREKEADRLGCRASVLDKLVGNKAPAQTNSELQGRKPYLLDVEPWPATVNGADLLSEVAKTFLRYVVVPDCAADALALWAAHAHCFECFQCSPRLNISSPEKGCGKSTLRDVVGLLVPRSLPAENLSVAVLFRIIESRKPTVLADEYDSWLPNSEEIRGILNAGHRRGGRALRCEGDSNEVREFNVFTPVVLCGIGSLPGTLHDRSIVIRLKRAKAGELGERFDSRRTHREQELSRKLARWCDDNRARLEASDPIMPDGAFNRLADNWRPLFAVAEVAGGDWPQRCADAFTKLTSREDSEAQGISTMLLADIRQVFDEMKMERILSKQLVESLIALPDKPWTEANKGREITQHWLARKLQSFGVFPKTVRIGNARANGYECDHFQDAFDRYLPSQGVCNRDNVTMPANTRRKRDSESVTNGRHVRVGKPLGSECFQRLSRCHTSNHPEQKELPARQ